MQSLVNAVRSTGATQPLLIGGLGWAGDLSQWLTYAPTDPNHALVASVHVYNFSGCNTATCWSASSHRIRHNAADSVTGPIVTSSASRGTEASGGRAGSESSVSSGP